MEKELRIIISGGGTGGHIFPAVSIANAIMELRPDAKILFVGAEGRMEMQRVPDAGYRIIGLPIAGFDRKHLWKNVAVLIKLARSQWKARSIIKNFRPQVAVGVGGYASGPTLKTAGMMGVPTLIQEQNSYAGVTNKLLAQKAKVICVAYDGMEKFFPADKIIMTGNPVRQNLTKDMPEKNAAQDRTIERRNRGHRDCTRAAGCYPERRLRRGAWIGGVQAVAWPVVTGYPPEPWELRGQLHLTVWRVPSAQLPRWACWRSPTGSTARPQPSSWWSRA